MTALKGRWLVVAIVGAAASAVVAAGMWALRTPQAVEYPADPTDTAPAIAAFDTSTLAIPGCPTGQPDQAPTRPGKAGDDKLVDWGAVRLVRCTYHLGQITYELERIDVVDDSAAVSDAVRVLRRMLTTAQFDEYFGPSDDTVRHAAAFPTYRYLFQFPDGHVTEVDYREGYHRDGILRHRWSLLGTSVAPLAGTGDRACSRLGPSQARTCRITGTTATLPD